MKQIVCIVTVGMVVLTGCGGGTGSKTPASRNTVGPALQVVSSTPSANARGVQVDARISVTVNGDLDPSSVTGQSVQLMPLVEAPTTEPDPDAPAMQRIVGEVTYTATTRTVTFTPSAHMLHGANYHLVLSNLRGVAGGTLGSAEVRFRTFNNNHVKSIEYDPATQAVVHTETFEYDAAGDMIRSDSYTGNDIPANLTEYVLHKNATLPGAPSVAIDFAEYDATNQLVAYGADVRENGLVVAHAMFDGPGADSLWNFTDDLVAVYELNAHRHAGHTLFSHYGAIVASQPWSSDPVARASKFAFVHGTLRENDGDGRSFRNISYSRWSATGPELDAAGNPKPVSDGVTSYRKFEYDPVGQLIRSWTYGSTSLAAPSEGGAGPDGAWLTADDVPSRVTATEYAADGHVQRVVSYSAAGPDGRWDVVADNDVSSFATFVYVPGTANLTQRITYAAGADKRIGGTDDVKVAEDFFDATQ